MFDCLKYPMIGGDNDIIGNNRCEEDLMLENAEEEILYVHESNVMVDINSNFPLQNELKRIINNYDEVFGPLDKDGMKVPPMQAKVKEGESISSPL